MARNLPGPADHLTVTAAHLDEHGAGVGVVDGLACHVADLLPGEEAEVALDHRSPHRPEAWGRVVRRIGPASPARVTPACPAAGRCGGCTWQHLDGAEALRAKHARVAAAVADLDCVRAGRVEVAAVRAAPAALGYRNKGKYVVGAAAGRVVLGAYAPRSHELVDTVGCQVVAPIIDELAAWTRGAAEAAGVVPYDERTHRGELRYVVIRASAAGLALVALVTPTRVALTRLGPLAEALGRHPAVRGVVWIRHDRRDGAIVPREAATDLLVGAATLPDQVAGVPIAVGAAEFLQVNRDQATALYARVGELAEAGPGVRAGDLYAGVGGIAFTLARAGARVTAIELDAVAARTLAAAAAAAGLPVDALAADAAALATLDARPDVVVVNPPRRGLSDAAHAAVLGCRPPRLLYVSCGPESLGRDLARWQAAGYQLDAIEPFDLMPGTGQVETVVRARLAAA
ncbi:MAG: 23S rRNA (uracil(1939)-C(5))-methyltransferase RlmD [Kofleriaceae bacterium]